MADERVKSTQIFDLHLEEYKLLFTGARLEPLVHDALVHRLIQKRVHIVKPEARRQRAVRCRGHGSSRLQNPHAP